MKNFTLLFLTILFFLFSNQSKAQILASDMAWECIGQDSFNVKLIAYVECKNDTFRAKRLLVKSDPDSCSGGNQQSFWVNLTLTDSSDVTPRINCDSPSCTDCNSSSCSYPVMGIRKKVYEAFVDLSSYNCCYWFFVYKGFYRTSSITTGPANSDFYTEAWMNKCVTPCNNSPQFVDPPFYYLCNFESLNTITKIHSNDTNSLGQLIDSIDFNRTSPNIDSFKSVSYSGFYTSASPLYNSTFSVDAFTGDVSFSRPQKIDKSITGIEIKEYRGHTLVGKFQRDVWLVADTLCDDISFISFGKIYNAQGASNNFRTSICSGKEQKVRIDFEAHYPEGYEFEIKNNKFPIKDIQVLPPDSGSRAGSVIITLGNFNVSSPVIYDFIVEVHNCLNNSRASQAYELLALSPYEFQINKTQTSCGDLEIQTSDIFGTQSFTYYYENDSSKSKNLNVKFDSSGSYPIIIKSETQVCGLNYYSDTVDISLMSLQSLKDTSLCEGDSVLLSAKINNGVSPINYLWTGDTSSNSDNLSIKKTGIFILSVSDSTGCTLADTSNVIMVANNLSITTSYGTCINDDPIMLLHPIGFEWFGTGIANDSFFQSQSGTGSFWLKYDPFDSIGCHYIDSLEATVYELPNVVAMNDVILCESSDSIELTGNPAGGIWTGSNVTSVQGDYYFNPATASVNMYDLIYNYFDQNGCENSDTMVVDVHEAPVADFSAMPTVGEAPLTVTFTDQSSGKITSWFWQFTSGNADTSVLQNPSFEYTDSGSYSIYLEVWDTAANCKDSLTKMNYITVDEKVSIAEFEKNFGVKIYPNPANELLVIELPENHTGNFTCSIFDANGKQVMDFDLETTTSKKDVSELGPGNYLVLIEDRKNKRSQYLKLVKGR